MPNVSELPSQPILIACVLAIVLTGLLGWLYASRCPVRPVRSSRRILREDGEPTLPRVQPVVDDITTPMAAYSMPVRTPRRRSRGFAVVSRRRA